MKVYWIILALLVTRPLQGAETERETKPAQLKISGHGIWGNRQLKKTLEVLMAEGKKPDHFDATFIEDAALVLISALNREGFLKAKISVRLTLENGKVLTYAWDEPAESPLPPSLRARKVHLKVKEGVRYHYDQIAFEGLQSLTEKRAKEFFIETGTLLPLKRYRVYTPSRLKRSLENLTEVLERQGYESAQATVTREDRNDRSGKVNITVEVHEGTKSIVRSVRQEIFFDKETEAKEITTIQTNTPYSRLWAQDFTQSLQTNLYHRGYPDAKASLEILRGQRTNDLIHLDLLAKVQTGPRIKVGALKFQGYQRTRESVLDRRVPLEEGEWLDRVAAERGRYRLSRLGIFESVDLSYEPTDADTRDVIYQLKEGKRIDLSLLFGYGSYELLRGGIELEQFNVLGRAHHSRLRLVQSFKSSSANYTYTMPELWRQEVDVFLNASALRREEIDFTRVEYGGGAGLRRFFKSIETDASVRYNYQILSATETDIQLAEQGVQEPGVGAIIIDLRHDRRDNPLYPHKGYKLFSNLELASEYLAGDVNYQRMEIYGSYHQPLDEGRWLHLGLNHGFVATMGSAQENLPFNKRFFPGGENSIRGYQDGEAAPRDAQGRIVGAETFLGGNIEFEQALTKRWSIVGFVDGIGFARRLADYPMDEALFSAGGGLRWRSIVGPIRLEYGHNLNPRKGDPSGTLHFSLGFPF
jgi:outer membrane protein assembly complex protein YaeT